MGTLEISKILIPGKKLSSFYIPDNERTKKLIEYRLEQIDKTLKSQYLTIRDLEFEVNI